MYLCKLLNIFSNKNYKFILSPTKDNEVKHEQVNLISHSSLAHFHKAENTDRKYLDILMFWACPSGSSFTDVQNDLKWSDQCQIMWYVHFFAIFCCLFSNKMCVFFINSCCSDPLVEDYPISTTGVKSESWPWYEKFRSISSTKLHPWWQFKCASVVSDGANT